MAVVYGRGESGPLLAAAEKCEDCAKVLSGVDLLSNAFFTVTVEGLSNRMQLVRVKRSNRTFVDIEDVYRQHNQLIAALDRTVRQNCYLIMDLRIAPGRSDPPFEAAMAKLRPQLVAGFRRVGILTQTAPGTLQVSRHMEKDRVMALISNSEEDILKFFRV